MATPDGWKRAQVADLFDLQLGKMLNKVASEQQPQFPYLGNKEVQWGRFDFSDLRRMHFSANEQTKFKLEPGDLLVCEGGEVGRAAVWRGEFDCYYQKAIHRLRARSETISPSFMFHFMRFAADNGLLKDLTSQSSIAHLTREKLARLDVPLPPLAEQRKIAAVLSAVDDVIVETEDVIRSLQSLKKAMMQELLTRGLPGRHTRFKQTEIGEIPEEWRMVSLGAASREKPRYGANVSKAAFDSRLPRYVRITDIDENGTLHSDDLVSITEENAKPYLLAEGDILLARSGATVGKSYVYDPGDGRCAHAGYLICFKADPNLARAKYIGWVLQSQRYWQWVRDSQRALAQPNINATEYSSFVLPLPILQEQVEIEKWLGALEARRRTEAGTVVALRHLKSALMSALLTGELRVTPNEDAA